MAEASGFDPTKLPPSLRSQGIVETAARSPELVEAGRFEEGQLSGPFGPRFVGYGEPPRLPLARYVAEWTAVLFVASLIAMAVL